MDADYPQHQLQQNTQPPSDNLAPQACSACKKQKRKCDKTLPTCSLCQRIGRPCDYNSDTQLPAPSPEDFAALRQQVSDLEQLLRGGANGSAAQVRTNGDAENSDGSSLTLSNGHSPANVNPLATNGTQVPATASTFPVLYFLDSNAFQYAQFHIQPPYVRVPPGALAALGSSQELRTMIEHYFATVHTYYPVVSKIRLFQHLSNPQHEPGSDIALLFLAMKLVCSEPPAGASVSSCQSYLDIKSFYHFLEASNGFSIQLIQALLLIALYEMGHAIYPAAYLTIGNAARLGHAMGLHAKMDAPQMLPRPVTWTEQEERRRVWWGVVILDRFINLGHRRKPFATNDPGLETHLPTDDESWDCGQMLVAAPLALSASSTIRAAPFARTCQASHLMGKIIRHIDDRTLPCDYRFQESRQLNRTMRALADAIPNDLEKHSPEGQAYLCTSMAICYSSLLTLYDAYSCTELALDDGGEDQLFMQQESIEGLREYSDRVLELARAVKIVVERAGIAAISPMIIDSVYQAAANQAWYSNETSQPIHAEKLAELRDVLVMLDQRWRVAGQYHFLLNDFMSREFHH